MKFKISSAFRMEMLVRRLSLEGNELDSGEDVLEIGKRWGEMVNESGLSALGLQTSPRSDYFITRWFHNGQWNDQTFLGIPTVGVGNWNQGANVEVGSVGLVLKPSAELGLEFEAPCLGDLISELKFSGLVTLRMDSQTLKPQRLETGVPSWGLYNMLEGVPAGVADWLAGMGRVRLQESWTVSSLVSRYPFPMRMSGEITKVDGLSFEMEKHFWSGESLKEFKNSRFTDSNLLGVATAWGGSPWAAGRRVESMCRRLVVPEVQFRTDGPESSRTVLRRLGLIRE